VSAHSSWVSASTAPTSRSTQAWCGALRRRWERVHGGGLGALAPADHAALEDEALATAFLTTVGEAFRQGVGGYAQDVVVQGRACSFAPVWVLHGEADTLVPVAHARHTTEMIPGARLLTWPDHGHIGILSEIPQLTADLVTAAR
jgi:pimeloyl-ACP methyl ester carboxylesterase